MSRIIAGQWKGHPLPSFKRGPVRPTSSRTRTVLFDTLPDLTGFSVLDLFSGTGSLGFEALSRGATKLVSVDKQVGYINQQKAWIVEHQAGDHFKAYSMDAKRFLDKNDDQFDLIVLDPPYALEFEINFWEQMVRHLNENGWLVYECARRESFEMPVEIDLSPYRLKQMGDSVLHFYSRGNA